MAKHAPMPMQPKHVEALAFHGVVPGQKAFVRVPLIDPNMVWYRCA